MEPTFRSTSSIASPSPEALWLGEFRKLYELNRSDQTQAAYDLSTTVLSTAKALFQPGDGRLVDCFTEAGHAAGRRKRYAEADEFFRLAIEESLTSDKLGRTPGHLRRADLWGFRSHCCDLLEMKAERSQFLALAIEEMEHTKVAPILLTSSRLKYASALFAEHRIEAGSRELSRCFLGTQQLNTTERLFFVDAAFTSARTLRELGEHQGELSMLQGLRIIAPKDLSLNLKDQIEIDSAIAMTELRKPGEAIQPLKKYLAQRLEEVKQCNSEQFTPLLKTLAKLQYTLCALYRKNGQPIAAETSALNLVKELEALLPAKDGKLIEFVTLSATQQALNCKHTETSRSLRTALDLPRAYAGESHQRLIGLIIELNGWVSAVPQMAEHFAELKKLLAHTPTNVISSTGMQVLDAFVNAKEDPEGETKIDRIIEQAEANEDHNLLISAYQVKATFLSNRHDFAGVIEISSRLKSAAGNIPLLFRDEIEMAYFSLKAGAQCQMQDLEGLEETLAAMRSAFSERNRLFGRDYLCLLSYEANLAHIRGDEQKHSELMKELEVCFLEYSMMNEDRPPTTI